MLTIKHIRPDDSENVREAYEVNVHRKLHEGADESAVTLFIDYWNAGTVEIRNGVVFVMNEAGATVAKYPLGDEL